MAKAKQKILAAQSNLPSDSNPMPPPAPCTASSDGKTPILNDTPSHHLTEPNVTQRMATLLII